jgi:hypothetical protein
MTLQLIHALTSSERLSLGASLLSWRILKPAGDRSNFGLFSVSLYSVGSFPFVKVKLVRHDHDGRIQPMGRRNLPSLVEVSLS